MTRRWFQREEELNRLRMEQAVVALVTLTLYEAPERKRNSSMSAYTPQ